MTASRNIWRAQPGNRLAQGETLYKRSNSDVGGVVQSDAFFSAGWEQPVLTTAVRLTQQFAEVLTTGDPASMKVRVSAQFTEVLTTGDPTLTKVRLSGQYVEVVYPSVGTVELDQQYVEVIAAPPGTVQLDTQYVEVIAAPISAMLVSQQYVEVIIPYDAPWIVAPSFYTDTDTFFAPTVSTSEGGGLFPGLFTDTDTFHQISARYQLQPGLVADSDAFYTATVTPGTVGLGPPRVVDADSLPTPSVGNRVAPSAISDSDQFYAPNAARGLAPTAYQDTDSVYATTLKYNVTLLPPFIAADDAFYTPTVQRQKKGGGGGTGGGGGSTTSDSKYASFAVIAEGGLITALEMDSTTAKTVNTRMMLYANSGGVPGALLATTGSKTSVVIGANIYPLTTPLAVPPATEIWIALHTDGNVAWFLTNSPAGSVFNTDLFSDGPTDPFGTATVDNKKAPVFAIFLEAVDATISPPLFTDSDVFIAPVVTGPKTLTPGLFSDTDHANQSLLSYQLLAGTASDSDQIFAVVLESLWDIAPSLFDDSDIVGSPIVRVSDEQIFPTRVVDSDVFLAPSISQGPGLATLAPQLVTDNDQFYVIIATSYNALTPGYVSDAVNDATFDPTVTYFNTILPGAILDQDVVESLGVSYYDELGPAEVFDDDTIPLASITWVNPVVPLLFDDTDIFGSPIFTFIVEPTHVADQDSHETSLLSYVLDAPSIADADQIYAPAAAYVILPAAVPADDLMVPAGITNDYFGFLVCASITLTPAVAGAPALLTSTSGEPAIEPAVAASLALEPAATGTPAIEAASAGTPDIEPAVSGVPAVHPC